ncbi:MAG TPA: cell division ATP-binding protein FtsE [Thiotrichales bacterium]|nr:cell division ATP-binding protein FtsE [Thiotrichales bacterium]
MLRFENVTKRYPTGQLGLDAVSVYIPRGAFMFLTGHSGAGKSTFLKLVALIERPSRGRILFEGDDISRLPRRLVPYHRRRLGVVYQEHHLLYDRNVFDNVALPLIIAGYSRREQERRVRAALDKVGLLGKEQAMPITLSGGEQQRVGIARAVVHRPRMVLADEPTGNLDPQLSAEIMRLFEDFSRIGVTVLVASHDAGLIRAMRRPVIRLHRGKLVRGDAEAAAGA